MRVNYATLLNRLVKMSIEYDEDCRGSFRIHLDASTQLYNPSSSGRDKERQ